MVPKHEKKLDFRRNGFTANSNASTHTFIRKKMSNRDDQNEQSKCAGVFPVRFVSSLAPLFILTNYFPLLEFQVQLLVLK